MIFLLNREYVMWEVVELARLHICEVLKVSTGKVEAKLDLADGKMSPEFLVDMDDVDGVGPDEIRDVMRHVYADVKVEAEVRLKGIDDRRENILLWLRGGLTEEEHNAQFEGALKPSVPIRLGLRWKLRKIGWRLKDVVRWVRLILTGIKRRIWK